MKIGRLHDWSVTVAEAKLLQQRLARRVVLQPLPRQLRLVAGADVAYSRREQLFFAAVVVLQLPSLEVVEERFQVAPARFPYVPGLLSFREAPALLGALAKLQRQPDLFVFDGQGLAHPLRLGLACHLGLWLNRPSIGCAKSRLVGTYRQPATRRGSRTRLMFEGATVGMVVRTRDGVKPVFVSPGHLADVPSAAGAVLRLARRFRLPEPTRLADIAAARLKRDYLDNPNDSDT